jgi:hypothetical protein
VAEGESMNQEPNVVLYESIEYDRALMKIDDIIYEVAKEYINDRDYEILTDLIMSPIDPVRKSLDMKIEIINSEWFDCSLGESDEGGESDEECVDESELIGYVYIGEMFIGADEIGVILEPYDVIRRSVEELFEGWASVAEKKKLNPLRIGKEAERA